MSDDFAVTLIQELRTIAEYLGRLAEAQEKEVALMAEARDLHNKRVKEREEVEKKLADAMLKDLKDGLEKWSVPAATNGKQEGQTPRIGGYGPVDIWGR